MHIVTDSKPPEARKDPDSCNLFSLYRHFAPAGAVEKTRRAYLGGGARYSDIKEELVGFLLAKFKEGRRHYDRLMRDVPAIERILAQGAVSAREIAIPRLLEVRRKIGMA